MSFLWNGKMVDVLNPIDLSIEIGNPKKWVRAWYQNAPVIEPVRMGDFEGSVASGAGVNFNNVFFNPHAHGTHTETYGHITTNFLSINDVKIPLFQMAYLLTIRPIKKETDFVIEAQQLDVLKNLDSNEYTALLLNIVWDKAELNTDFSETNPPYLDTACITTLNQIGIQHLLINLPSVDREKDEGKLAFHHIFWGIHNEPQPHKTITEFIYVPHDVVDGPYVLSLQVAPFHNDAAPSRPILYKIQ